MALYHKLSDAELAGLLKSGDSAAFTEIYDRYWALLFRHARRMLKDDEEAGDVVQDIFTVLWNKISEISFTTSLSSYLYSSVRNRTIDLLNRGKTREKFIQSLGTFLEQETYDLQEDLIVDELARRIEEGITKLPPKMREVFELSRKANLSHKQIASQLDISDTTVKKQISRAIKILRMRMDLFLIATILFFS